MLSREEAAGVIAHELAHIKNRDTLIMTITATIAGAISMLAQFGMFFRRQPRQQQWLGVIGTLAMVILAPIAAMLVQMAVSRTREYAADRLGAQIAASRAISRPRSRKLDRPRTRSRTSRLSTIPRPRTCSSSIRCPAHGMDNLFATHPRPRNRIAALEQLAAEMGRGGTYAAAAAARRDRARRTWGQRRGPWG
jgi:heat shock protein HtpX